MKIVLDIDEITKYNIQYYEPIHNTILHDSTFIRTGFSNKYFTTNDINISIEINLAKIDKYLNKYAYIFDYYKNYRLIDKIVKLEKIILDNICTPGVHPKYKLSEQLMGGTIHIFNLDNPIPYFNTSRIHKFKLKISGIWKSQTAMALTYKFILDY